MKQHYRALALGSVLAIASACEATPADLREWTPADHKHQTESSGTSSARRAPERNREGTGMSDVARTVWKNQCASCHGAEGRGDGPQSVMVQARDLTTAAWQNSVSDDAIFRVIKEGKGKMPPFRFPDTMISAVVDVVRSFGRGQAVRPVSGSPPPPSTPPQPMPAATAPGIPAVE
jgi:hypothetical protein